VPRQVLYLGEIHDRQEAAWRKTVEVFAEQTKETRQLALFPSERPVPPEEVNALSVVLREMRLRRARGFGDGWLGCLLWEELGLSWFWNGRLQHDRGAVPWSKVLQLLVVHRLCAPGAEFFVPRRWFLGSARDVHIPTTDGRELVMPRHTQAESEQQMVLEKLKLTLPAQPPPCIRGGDVLLPTLSARC